jgi:hypothetical protein
VGGGRRGDRLGHLGPRRTDRPGGAGRPARCSARSRSPWTCGHTAGDRARSSRRERSSRWASSAASTRATARAGGGALGPARPAAHRTGDDLRPVAAARRVSAAVRRAVPGHPGPRLRHAALGDRPRGRRGVRDRGRTPGPRCSARRATSTRPRCLTLDDGTLATATATRLNGAGYDVRMELAGELDQFAVGLDDRTPIASTEPMPGRRPRQAVDRASWSGSGPRTRPSWTPSSRSSRESWPIRATGARRCRRCGSRRRASCPGVSADRCASGRSRGVGTEGISPRSQSSGGSAPRPPYRA